MTVTDWWISTLPAMFPQIPGIFPTLKGRYTRTHSPNCPIRCPAKPTSSTAIGATEPSKRSLPKPVSRTHRRRTAWESVGEISTAMDGPISMSPTTHTAIFCFTTKGMEPLRISASIQAPPTGKWGKPTATWHAILPTSTTTAGLTCSSPVLPASRPASTSTTATTSFTMLPIAPDSPLPLHRSSSGEQTSQTSTTAAGTIFSWPRVTSRPCSMRRPVNRLLSSRSSFSSIRQTAHSARLLPLPA